MTAKIEQLAKATRRLPKIEESLRVAREKLDEANGVVEGMEAELHELGDAAKLEADRAEIQEKLKTNKEKLIQFKVKSSILLCTWSTTS